MSDINENTSDQKGPPITDSPWFWGYLFATGGLIALFLMGPKYDSRQAQIEREFSARQSHGHTVTGTNGPLKPPVTGEQNLRLGPIFVIVGGIFIIAWSAFWYQRIRMPRQNHTVTGRPSE